MGLEHSGNVARATGDDSVTTGRFTYDVVQDVWWWSDTTYRIHGFEPGEVVPTTRLVLAHKHPDDAARFAEIFGQARRTGEPFVSVHRIMAATGRTRNVVLAGLGSTWDDRARTLTGCFVDVTDQVLGLAEQLANDQIRDAARSRATIEQAKGALSLVWRVDPEEAFARLRRISMRVNVPVRELAREAVAGGPAGALRVGELLSHELLADE